MGSPFVGEIRMFGGNFAPAGWMFCEGQLLPITEYEVLFNLIGTTYGGDGQTTFALPDLRGRVPIHVGIGFIQGQRSGVETVTLTVNQAPQHSHPLLASTAQGLQGNAAGSLPAASNTVSIYKASTPSTPMGGQAIGSAGGSQPHSNMQPYLCVDFIISLFGIFPSQS
jgi:microcystin-dependent protein